MELKFKHFIFLNILDVITTYYAITYLGLSEYNTFANRLFNQYGLVTALILMKIIGLIVIYGMVQIYTLKIKKLAINICCFIFIAVVLNNLYWILKYSF